jgi:hypothetical protein
LNKQADWIPVFAGMTKIGGFEKFTMGSGPQADRREIAAASGRQHNQQIP